MSTIGQVAIACLRQSISKSAALVGCSWSAGSFRKESLARVVQSNRWLPVLSIRSRVFDASWFATYEETEGPRWLLPTSDSIKNGHVKIRTGLINYVFIGAPREGGKMLMGV